MRTQDAPTIDVDPLCAWLDQRRTTPLNDISGTSKMRFRLCSAIH